MTSLFTRISGTRTPQTDVASSSNANANAKGKGKAKAGGSAPPDTMGLRTRDTSTHGGTVAPRKKKTFGVLQRLGGACFGKPATKSSPEQQPSSSAMKVLRDGEEYFDPTDELSDTESFHSATGAWNPDAQDLIRQERLERANEAELDLGDDIQRLFEEPVQPRRPTLGEILAQNPLPPSSLRPKPEKLKKGPNPPSDPELDNIRHKFHRTTVQRAVGNVTGWLTGRSTGTTWAFGSKVTEAPAGAKGKPNLVNPNDAANPEARMAEVRARTEELKQHLSVDGPAVEHAPMGRKPKSGIKAKIKAKILGATSLTTLAGKVQKQKPGDDAKALLEMYTQSADTLRAEIARREGAVTTAQGTLDLVEMQLRIGQFQNRNKTLATINEKRAELEAAVTAHQTALDVLESVNAGERIDGGVATLAKISYAQGELMRFNGEIAKLLAPGLALPGAAELWEDDLLKLSRPISQLVNTLNLQMPEAGDAASIKKKLEPGVGAFGKLATAFTDPASVQEAGASVLLLAEEVVGHSESVYLELSKSVKAEAKALRIAESQVQRLQTLLEEDGGGDNPVAARAALETATNMRDGAALTLQTLRAARTAMKVERDTIRETYHQIALKVSEEAVKAPDAELVAPAVAAFSAPRDVLLENHNKFVNARTQARDLKKARRAAEAERIQASINNPAGFINDIEAPAGLDRLKAELATASAALSPKRVGTELAASAVLDGLSRGLAIVTGGDPERAANAAHALTHHSLVHWLDCTATDQTSLDVINLHRHMSKMPRGMEVLARLSLETVDLTGRDLVAVKRSNVTPLRVFWVADSQAAQQRANAEAGNGAAPPGVDAAATEVWLNNARAMARHKLLEALQPDLPQETVPTAQQKAAFNGVRNDYVALGPGTPYARAGAMLDKLVNKWTTVPDRYALPLDVNLSSDQIRDAAETLRDFVAGQPPVDEQRPPEEARLIGLAKVQLSAFANFARAHTGMHAHSKLSDRHIEELTQAVRADAALAQLGDAAADEVSDAVFTEGMTFAEALAAATTMTNRVLQAPQGLRDALKKFEQGEGERQVHPVSQMLTNVGTAVMSGPGQLAQLKKNPLNDYGMKLLNEMSSGLGMNTRPKMAEGHMHAVFDELKQAAQTAGRDDLAIVCDGLRRLEGSKIIEGKLSREYAGALQKRIDETALGADGVGHAVRTDISVHEYATELLEQLRGDVGDMAPRIEETLLSARKLHDHPDLPPVKTMGDMATVFQQFVSEDELRDKRKIINGHEFGASVPLFPWTPGIPVGVTAKYSVKKEEMLEVGMYINLAEIATHKKEIGANAGYNFAEIAVGGMKNALIEGKNERVPEEEIVVGAMGSVNYADERQTITTFSMRLPRQRGTEAKLRQQVPQIMHDLADFAVTPPEEREHNDPMAVLLANHQDLALALSDDQGAWTKTREARISFLNAAVKAQGNSDATVGLSLGAAASLESSQEWKKESVGAFTTEDYTSSVKAAVAGDFLLRMPVRVEDQRWEAGPSVTDGKKGAFFVPAAGLPLVGGFRNFYQRLDKMQISVASAEGAVIDADTDEFSYSPDDMLQDLKDNREAWLERGLNVLMKRTLPQEPGATGRPEPEVPPHLRETVGRRKAEAELAQYEEAVKEMGKNNKFTQFNINYSLNDDAKGILGDLKLAEVQAREAGDEAAANLIEQQVTDLLKNPASWEPNKVMARVKAKVPVTMGVDFVVKAKSTFQVEGQRVPWQYPA